MPSLTRPACHTETTIADSSLGQKSVALLGPPNSGKSTLFNALTNARRSVGNWPGTSVEVGQGLCSLPDGTQARLFDLPGAYSLDPQSPDEALTRELLERPIEEQPDLVVVVMDANKISQGLYLTSQLRDLCVPFVLALTMNDVAKRRGVEVDVKRLAQETGAQVVALDPRRVRGVETLRNDIATMLDDANIDRTSATQCLLQADDIEVIDRRFLWVETVLNTCVRFSPVPRTWSDRIDSLSTARFLGPAIFLAIMWMVFQATTVLAAPLQDGLSNFFTGPVTDIVHGVLQAIGLGSTWINDLLVDGVIAGVGMLVSFLPLMAIMFLLLSILEDSGYMARAAVVANRMMRAIGLPGKAFLPLIVGFGCNVPAISATRVLSNSRHRIMTSLLIPFTSCSARLTVYAFVAATFFPRNIANVIFVMYVLSIVLVVVTGLAMRKTLWRTVGNDPLLIELPPYQRPVLRVMTLTTWVRIKGFLRTATGIILATVIGVWLLQATPLPGHGSFNNVDPEHSAFAGVSRVITPVFAPLGFDDWRTASALVVGFIAKEAVISSWAQTYAVEEPTNPNDPGALGALVRDDIQRASAGHELAAIWAFLIFLLAYTPCVATLAAQRREIGMRWTVFGVGMQLGVAWLLALVVFQIGSRIT